MSIRLVRQASDTPNVTNRDDTRMTRYAYGGIDGVMKDYGTGLSYSISGSNFILNSGCIVLQGWEVIVDSWELDLSTVVNTQYHTVYLEVNVASESATIKSTYQTGAFPSIDAGNDLTTYPNGTARLPLYTFVVKSGRISSVTKKFTLLSYYGDKVTSVERNILDIKTDITDIKTDITDIKGRLSNLGFKQGSVTVNSDIPLNSPYKNTITRQGNYVIGTFGATYSKQLDISQVLPQTIGTLPNEFRPQNDVVLMAKFGGVEYSVQDPLYQSYSSRAGVITIFDDGTISVHSIDYGSPTYVKFVIDEIVFELGYEAAPLT